MVDPTLEKIMGMGDVNGYMLKEQCVDLFI
jgi:hypothetical protein